MLAPCLGARLDRIPERFIDCRHYLDGIGKATLTLDCVGLPGKACAYQLEGTALTQHLLAGAGTTD